MEHKENRKAIGIDLGTTQSCVGVWQDDHVQIIPNDLGHLKTPNCVAFTNTRRLVGDAAKNQIEKNRENTIYDAKRLLGKSFNDRELQKQLHLYPFKVINNEGRPQFEVKFKGEIKRFAPEQIISMTLAKLKENAESHLGQKVTDAVIAVPASFNSCQRQAVKDAGTIAGLNVISLVNEPTAAAITYALHNSLEDDSNVLVLDLGSGFCGVTILNVADSLLEVTSTCGTSHLGRRDIDDALVNYFSQEFEKKYKKDLKSNPKAMSKLRIICERVKRSLSSNSVVAFEIESLHEGIEFTSKINRDKLEFLCHLLFRDILELVKAALKRARLDKSEINEIILVGGLSKIPKIQQLLQEFFDGKVLNRLNIPNNDAAVAQGVAIQAAVISKHFGARIPDPLLLDATSFSFGIKAEGEVITSFTMKNTTVPTQQSQTVTIHSKIIEIYEGERRLAKDNHFLGTIDLSGIVPPEGEFPRKIEITFEFASNLDLKVTAGDVCSKKYQQIPINYNKSRLTNEEIAEMIKMAEEDDRKLMERDKVGSRFK